MSEFRITKTPDGMTLCFDSGVNISFNDDVVEKLKEIARGNENAVGEKVEIGSIEPGKTVLIGGDKYEILDSDFKDVIGDRGVFVLAKESLFEKTFDEGNCNNWKSSSLRKYLNGEWLEELKKEVPGEYIMPFKRDLTSDDGLHDYGTCEDFVSLIICDEYRKYHEKYISNKKTWWWTLTPYSTPYASYPNGERLVYADGSLYYSSSCNGSYGVAPALLLLPSLLVEIAKNDEEGEE